jgi:thermitase
MKPKLILMGSLYASMLLAQPREFVPGRILAQERSGSNRGQVISAIAKTGGQSVRLLAQTAHHVIDVPEARAAEVMEALSKTNLFAVLERDGVAHGSAVPNDPSFGTQWHLATIQAATAWNWSTGSASPIAVIDSGIDPTHPDLASRLTPGWNFLGSNSDTRDVLGHGTAVAGTIGAASNNYAGVSGVTWQNPLMPLVVLDSSNYASYSNIAQAIMYAADRGARIINISIGGSSASSTLQSAVNYAWSKGAVVFAAAMNNANSTPMYPAACTNVVAVSATTQSDALASFSSFGSWVDLSA